MKIATIVIRSLMGLLFIFASIVFLFKLVTPPPAFGAMKIFNEGLQASIYLLPTVAVVELVCGLSFISGKYVTFSSILIAPIIVNIFFVHAFIDPKGLPVAIFLVFSNAFLAYGNRENYKNLFKV